MTESGSPLSGDKRLMAARLARHAAVIGIAGVLTGVLVGGVGGRLLMRVAAITAPDGAAGVLTDNGGIVSAISLWAGRSR